MSHCKVVFDPRFSYQPSIILASVLNSVGPFIKAPLLESNHSWGKTTDFLLLSTLTFNYLKRKAFVRGQLLFENVCLCECMVGF